MPDPNRLPHTDLAYDRCQTDGLEVGDWIRPSTRWLPVTGLQDIDDETVLVRTPDGFLALEVWAEMNVVRA